MSNDAGVNRGNGHIRECDGGVARQARTIVIELLLERDAAIIEAPERKKQEVDHRGGLHGRHGVPDERPSNSQETYPRPNHHPGRNEQASGRDVEQRNRKLVGRGREERLDVQIEPRGVDAFNRLRGKRRNRANDGGQYEHHGLDRSRLHTGGSRSGSGPVMSRMAR